MTTPMRDLASPGPWEHSMERSRRRRAITPEARKRLNRRRRASTALTTLMVAGPAGQVLAATGTSGDGGGGSAASPVDRAIGGPAGGLMFEIGSTGAAVQAIQERLGVPADGVYGPVTEGAVRDFQARAQILVDGVVGPITWTKLFGLDRAAASAGAARGEVAVIVRERRPAERNAGRTVPAFEPVKDKTETVPTVERAPSGVPSPGAPRSDPQAQTPAARPAPAPPASGPCGTLRLATPVKGVRTSPFGPRWGRNHDGVDIAAPTGTPVRAAECGVVTVRGPQGGYGNMVCVEHSGRFETCYAHLSRFGVNEGQLVRRGQVIGYVGCTGSCTGPHLHFETRVDGRAQDPDAYLRGRSVPGEPRVSRASQTHTAKAGAQPMATESKVQRAAPASSTGPATSVRRAPAQPGAPEPFVQQAPVEQAAPTPDPVEPVVTEQAPVVEQVQAAPAPPAAQTPEPPAAQTPEPPAAQTLPAPMAQAPAPVEPPAPAPAPAPVEPVPVAPQPVEPVGVQPELPTPVAEAPLPAEAEAVEPPAAAVGEPTPLEAAEAPPEGVDPAP